MSVFGTRIHVIGNSCAGKSTLAAELGAALELSVVELDALNWLPGWVGLNATDPDELRRRINEATSGERWVVAGSYAGFCADTCWPRLQTMIWLDLPRSLLIRRVLIRSWKRWRSGELLWGTNRENFWNQLKIWNKEDSLIWWIWTQAEPKRKAMVARMGDARYGHIRFVRLTSPKEVLELRRALGVQS